ncbi:MAG: Fic/DOC family protein [Bryobacteraceae bacterium]
MDPYLYPGTEVLRNIPDIHDAARLAAFEANATAARLAELGKRPLPGDFDIAHLQAIHQFVFQDVYSWAGQFRTVNISKGGHLFGVAAFVQPALDDVLRPSASVEPHLTRTNAQRIDDKLRRRQLGTGCDYRDVHETEAISIRLQ